MKTDNVFTLHTQGCGRDSDPCRREAVTAPSSGHQLLLLTFIIMFDRLCLLLSVLNVHARHKTVSESHDLPELHDWPEVTWPHPTPHTHTHPHTVIISSIGHQGDGAASVPSRAAALEDHRSWF